MEKFLALKQGSSSVKEYVNKFNQLARFGLELVNTPEKKALRFVRGLNEPLQGLAMTHIPMGATFEKLVEIALMHEDKAVENKGDQKKPQQQNKKGGKNNNGKGKKRCFNCGTPGHLSKDCRERTGNYEIQEEEPIETTVNTNGL